MADQLWCYATYQLDRNSGVWYLQGGKYNQGRGDPVIWTQLRKMGPNNAERCRRLIRQCPPPRKLKQINWKDET